MADVAATAVVVGKVGVVGKACVVATVDVAATACVAATADVAVTSIVLIKACVRWIVAVFCHVHQIYNIITCKNENTSKFNSSSPL